jgi:CRP-like cAMP-binding protein
VRKAGICAVFLGNDCAPPARLGQAHLTARSRQNIYRAGDSLATVAVICEGFAFRFVMLPDGRRQILSFLMSGDIIWSGAFLRDRLHFSVQSITPLRYCAYDRAQIVARILQSPSALMSMTRQCLEECEAADHTIVNLGRRSADERVAQLLLDIIGRQERLHVEQPDRYEFPLKQLHIADAVGLTQIHVSRVLNKLKRAKVIDLSEGVLTVLDLVALQRIGENGGCGGR